MQNAFMCTHPISFLDEDFFCKFEDLASVQSGIKDRLGAISIQVVNLPTIPSEIFFNKSKQLVAIINTLMQEREKIMAKMNELSQIVVFEKNTALVNRLITVKERILADGDTVVLLSKKIVEDLKKHHNLSW